MNERSMQPGETMMAESVAVEVWEWPVRAFHWSLVALVVGAVVTAKVGGNAMVWHMRCGFAILALVLFRVLWGFAGGRHARFTSFLRGPSAVIDFARSFATRPHPPSVGHNPLGGWSVVALLVVLLIQAATGLFANDDIVTDGPLVKFISKDLSDTITGYHHLNLWALGALVALHVAAVFYHLLALKDNLIRPMVTGFKRLPSNVAGDAGGETSHLRAVVLLALCGLAVWGVVSKA